MSDSHIRLQYNSIDLDRFDGGCESDVDRVRRELAITKDDVVLCPSSDDLRQGGA